MTSISTPANPARRMSPDAVRSGGQVRMFVLQTRAELVKLLRAPDFVAPVVLLPVLLFVLFGAASLGETIEDGRRIGPVIAASFASFGVLGVVVFTFGEAVGAERGQGWLRLMRATPLPGSIFLGAKLGAGLALAVLFFAVMIPVATVAGAGIDAAGWLRVAVVAILGGTAIAPLGFVIGFVARPSAVAAVALLLYLPLSYASGMWTPYELLPDVVQQIAPFLPTYHLASLTHHAVGFGRDAALVHAGALIATLAAGSALAAVAYRRAAGRQFA